MPISKPRIIPENARGSANPAWLIVVIALAAGVGGLLLGLQSQQKIVETQALTRYPDPRPLRPLDLVSTDGAVTRESFAGQWNLVFFGFTHCPDVCPNTMALMRQVINAFDESPPQVWLISVDPERDTPEVLAQYAEYFDPSFRGATGSPEAIAELAAQLNVAYFIEPHEAGDTSYTVDHSSAVLVIDPQARLYALASAPIDPEALASDLLRLRDS